jgi:hypothetical protein
MFNTHISGIAFTLVNICMVLIILKCLRYDEQNNSVGIATGWTPGFDSRQGQDFVFLVSLCGVRLSPLGTSATVGLLYQPRMIDDYGTVGGMRIGRGNRSTRRKPAPVPLCPPQIPHYLIWDRTRAAAVGSQRLTDWAMARPNFYLTHSVQTGSGAYPASYAMGTGGFFPWGKAVGAWSWPLTAIYLRGIMLN